MLIKAKQAKARVADKNDKKKKFYKQA